MKNAIVLTSLVLFYCISSLAANLIADKPASAQESLSFFSGPLFHVLLGALLLGALVFYFRKAFLNFLKEKSLRFRLITVSGLGVATTLVVYFVSSFYLQKVAYEVEDITETMIPLMETINVVELNQVRQDLIFRKVKYAKLENNFDNLKKYKKELYGIEEVIAKDIHKAEKIIEDGITKTDILETKEKLKNFSARLEKLVEMERDFNKKIHSVVDAMDTVELSELQAEIKKVDDFEAKLIDVVHAFMVDIQAYLDSSAAHVVYTENLALRLSLLVVLISIVFGVYLSSKVLESVLEPFGLSLKGLSEISKGNYSHQIPVATKEEFGKLAAQINALATEVNTSISKANQATQEAEEASALAGEEKAKAQEALVTANEAEQNAKKLADEQKAFSQDLAEKVDTLLNTVAMAAQGDLSVYSGVEGEDQIGKVAGGFNSLLGSLNEALLDIRDGVVHINQSSQDLLVSNELLENNTKETTQRVQSISAAIEEVNANLNSVSVSAEELLASVGQINDSAQEGANIASSTSNDAVDAQTKMTELVKSCEEISNFVESISDIAAKTNMLALNATIEAARAGEAGKGFAVVANEVKELANKTVEAASEINLKVENVMNNSQIAEKSLDSIVDSIKNLAEKSLNISTTVNQQNVATSEILRSVSESSQATNEVSSQVVDVATNAEKSLQSCMDTKDVAEQLAGLAESLDSKVKAFKLKKDSEQIKAA